jgi:hypothetical protein
VAEKEKAEEEKVDCCDRPGQTNSETVQARDLSAEQ